MSKRRLNLEAEIKAIKKEILLLGDLRPGTLTAQYNTCGNPTCRCKDDSSARHGPYHQLSYTRNGQSKTEYVKQAHVERVNEQIKNYTRLQTLIKRWVDLSTQICQLK